MFLPLNTAIVEHQQGATLKRVYTFYNPDTKELESRTLVKEFPGKNEALTYYDDAYPDWAKEISENYSLLHKEQGITLFAC